LIKNLLA
jgi:hypothetical protein